MWNKIKYYFLAFSVIPYSNLLAGTKIPLDGNITSLEQFLKVILKSLLNIVVPIIVLMIVYVGFLFIKAQGNDSELSKAKEALSYVLIGTAIVIAASAIYSILYAAHV